MIEKPIVSVVIPAWNPGEFLRLTIESVYLQMFKDWEIILVNDGSTKAEFENMVRISEEDVRISLLPQPNLGVSTARNLGFRHSNGKYLAFLDADDLWLPENLLRKVTYLENHPEVGLVHSDMQVINDKSSEPGSILTGQEGDVLDQLLLWESTVIPAPSSILVRRSVIESIGQFDEELSTAADQEFFFRVSAKYKIGRIPLVLGKYRVHDKNMSKSYQLFEQDHQLAYKKASTLGLFKNWRFRRRCFSNMYLIIAGTWWGDGKSRLRGFIFILKALLVYPLSIVSLTQKLYTRFS